MSELKAVFDFIIIEPIKDKEEIISKNFERLNIKEWKQINETQRRDLLTL